MHFPFFFFFSWSFTKPPLDFPVQVHPGYPVLPPISSADVLDFWTKLREHIDTERLTPYEQHGNQRRSNKVVRIFVSSTFTDFFNEREVLIKKVFPALRDEMTSSGIQIIDCDLRWGVNPIEISFFALIFHFVIRFQKIQQLNRQS